MYFVYILICSDKKTYIGCTQDIEERLDRHQKGYVSATQDHLPVTLLSYFAFQDKYTAFNFERYLKSGSGRAWLRKHVLKSEMIVDHLT